MSSSETEGKGNKEDGRWMRKGALTQRATKMI